MTQLTSTDRTILAVMALDHNVIPTEHALALLRDGLPDGTSFPGWLSRHVPLSIVLRSIAMEVGVAHVDLSAGSDLYSMDATVNETLDLAVFRDRAAVPMRNERTGQLFVLAANPLDVQLTDYVHAKLPNAQLALASQADVRTQIVYLTDVVADGDDGDDVASGPGGLSLSAQEVSRPVEWLDQTLERAVAEGASDIHLTWDLDMKLHLRLRIDGILREVPVPLRRQEMTEAINALLNKCEGARVENTREPIDATFSFYAQRRRIDARLAMLPQINGRTIVVRLLDPESVRGNLTDKGFHASHVRLLRRAVAQTQGMVVVTGPTGSGKSTTLYTLLNEIDALKRNIHTVENPVEYRIAHVNQTPIRDDIGDRSITFARALRSILRLDPDVILVGEMRDLETAKTGLDASITGHLVLSTLHANDSIKTFSRLIEMDVPPYLVAEAITASVSQRLVRTMHTCASRRPPTSNEVALLAKHGVSGLTSVAVPGGCAGCGQTGYRGRAAVLEVLCPTRELREAITSRASDGQLYRMADQAGFQRMFADGLRLVRDGVTDLNEIRRVLTESETS
jgi:type IV pilus assembly protein PilB